MQPARVADKVEEHTSLACMFGIDHDHHCVCRGQLSTARAQSVQLHVGPDERHVQRESGQSGSKVDQSASVKMNGQPIDNRSRAWASAGVVPEHHGFRSLPTSPQRKRPAHAKHGSAAAALDAIIAATAPAKHRHRSRHRAPERSDLCATSSTSTSQDGRQNSHCQCPQKQRQRNEPLQRWRAWKASGRSPGRHVGTDKQAYHAKLQQCKDMLKQQQVYTP